MKKFTKKLALIIWAILFVHIAEAQNWQPLGSNDDNQPTFAGASTIFVKANHAGAIYVAYNDANSVLRVRKNNGTQWVDVGGNISLGGTGMPSLAFDTADVPYIAYPDFGFFQGCVSVKKFQNGVWQQVGSNCFSNTFPDNVHIGITSKDSVFVLWRDGNNNKTNMKKYDGSANWNFVGGADFSGVTTLSCDMAIDASDSIYVAYTNSSNNLSSIKKLSNNNWIPFGNTNFTVGTNVTIRLILDVNNNPVVGYVNTANGNKPTAMQWNGSSWNTIGTTLAGSATSDGSSFVFMMANGMPTFAYSDFGAGSTTVQQFNGANWSYVGGHYISTLNASISSLGAGCDSLGNICVLYRDGYNLQKITAKKYLNSSWTDFETRGLAVGYMTDVRTFVDYNGIPYICYSDVINGYKACVKKFVGGAWTDVGVNGFSTDRADNITLAFDKNSVPYVCYHDWAVNGSTVQKFNGTTWVTVGVKDITGRTAFIPCMAMDTATTTPYVISQDDNAHFYKAIVSKFDGTNWVNVGPINFSNGRVFNPKIVVTSTGVPYITYGDENLNSQAIVKKFDGTNWVDVGSGTISGTFNTDYNTISVGKNDTIYAAYKDNQVTYKVIVKKFDGTGWTQLGSNIGIGSTKYVSLTNNISGVPYIAYSDAGDANKAYVKKFNKSFSTWDDVAATSGGITPGSADWVSIASNKINNTFYLAYAFGDVYAKTIGLSITATAGAGGTITPSGSVDVANGTNKSYMIAANAGFCIQDVVVDGVSVGETNTYTFTNVTISHTIAASFVAQLTPSVSIAASPSNHVCAGANVTFTATPTNGGSSPTYNFFVNGNSLQNSNSNTFSSSSLNHSDDVTCILTANNFCQTTATANSNSIRMTVDASLTPSVTLMASSNNVCAGSNITFTATATNGGSSPMYNFLVNGNSIQNSGSNTYSSSNFNNNDDVKCVLTANNTCQTSATANSNIVTMQLLTNVTPSVSIASNSGLNICSGSNVTFTATSINGGSSPTYNFFLNGNSVQNSASNTYSISALNTNDNISCIMTSNNQCQTTNTSNSNNLVMTLTANATPTISIQSNAGSTICSGANVVFTATANNGGNVPTYQWKKNGNNVGINSNTYADNNLTNNDSIWCVLTSNSVCVVTPTAISNKVKTTVNALPAAVAAITGNTTSCTIGGTNNLTNATNGGVWNSSNTSVATISNTGKVTAVSNGTSNISYTITNANGCSQNSTAVYTVASVNVTPITGLSNVCVGATVQLSNATPNGVWVSLNNRASVSANGLLTGLNGGEYAASIKYTVTNANGCSAFVNYAVTVNAIPNVPTITYAPGTPNPQAGAPTGSFCVGKVFTVVGTPNAPAGAWSSTGVVGITNGGVVSINAVGAGSIKYTYTNINGCSNSRTMVGNGFTCAARGVVNNNEQLAIGNEFSIYPNPAKSFISLNVNSLIGAGSIVVTDLYGKTVKTQPLSVGTNTLDIANLSKGFYLVSMITNEGKITKKLVVE